MANLLSRTSQTYPAGSRTFGPATVPTGLTQLVITFTREAWPDTGADVLRITADLSLDGGANWAFHCGFTARGGTILDRGGSPLGASFMRIALPDPSNAGRRLRLNVQTFASLTSAITMDVT